MKSANVTRRLVLRGAGGFTLALPLLPSLMGKNFANAAPKLPPRFVAFNMEQGGVLEENMYPSQSTLTQRMEVFPGHEVAAGRLVATMDGSDAVLSPALRAPASILTPTLISKLNVLHGLDIPWGVMHHSGAYLGNYAANLGNGEDGRKMQAFPRPTIDQVMAWSPAFYPSLEGIKERAILTGGPQSMSFNYSNPAARTGAIREMRYEPDSLRLFNRIFVPSGGTKPQAEPHKPIVDRVIENYRSLRQSNKRMGNADRQRLDDHMARLAELQRNLTVKVPVECSSIAKPADDTSKIGESYNDLAKATRRYELYNDVIAAAFICGTSRIATVRVHDWFATFAGDWHMDVAHMQPSMQPTLLGGAQKIFERVFVDLMKKLDVDEGYGTTYLDNTLMHWSHECGYETHNSFTLPVVTAGSAAGFLKTGQYIDFRNKSPAGRIQQSGGLDQHYHGLTYNRWLATALQAVGVPRSEFEREGEAGYGLPYVEPHYAAKYAQAVASAGEILPFLKA